MKIEKVKKGKCVDCGKKATKDIDNKLYCAHCGDTRLLLTIKSCILGIEEAIVKISIKPKSKIWEKEKNEHF